MSKLLRKDVLKLIDGLTSGEYKKGKNYLVNDNGSTFCCLGVWADQHGCVWHVDPTSPEHAWMPSMRGKEPPENQGTGLLKEPITFGLTSEMQTKLSNLNDEHDGWTEVLHYLVDEVLPKAK